jgi:nitrogen fixation NifU-like protein
MNVAADLYQQEILQRSRHPRHAGRPARFDTTASRDNPLCGDHITVFAAFTADGAIAEASFDAQGCAVFLASAELMAEAVSGLGAAEARKACQDFLDFARGKGKDTMRRWPLLAPLAHVTDFPARTSCATLPWEALAAALVEGGQAG